MNSKNVTLIVLMLLALLVFIPVFSNAGAFDSCGPNCIISSNMTISGTNVFHGTSFTILQNASITLSPSQVSTLQINADSIDIQGAINANGSDGANGTGGNWWSTRGESGENAGTIILNGSFINVSGSIIANGGNGGNGGDYCPINGLAQSASNGGNGGSGGILVIYYSNLSFEGNLSLNQGLGGIAGFNKSCYPSFAKNGSDGRQGIFEAYQTFQKLSTINPQNSTITSGQTENLSVSQGSGVWNSSNSTIARVVSQSPSNATIQGWIQGTAVITIASGGQSSAELPLSANWTGFLNQQQYQFETLVFSVQSINSTLISLYANSQSIQLTLNINATASIQGVNITLEKIVNGVAYLILSGQNPIQTQTATVTVTPGNLTAIIINPNPASIPINSTQQFNATAFDVAGNVIPTNGFNWNASSNLGFVNQTGFFTSGFKAGSLQLTASIGNVTGTAAVTINPGQSTMLLIQPYNPAVQAYSTTQFNATAFDAYNNSITANANWTANGNCNITNSSVTVQGEGTCIVTATYQNISNQSIITIINQTLYIQGPSTVTAGNTSQYQAVYCNNTCSIVNASWSGASSNGTFTLTATGTYTIYAYYNGSTANFTITVTPALPSYISMPQYALTAGVPQQLYAYVYDTLGNQITNATVNFMTTSINGTAVIMGGYIFGEKAGYIRLEAFWGGLEATSTSIVYSGTPVSLQVIPFNPSISLYSSHQLNAIATDSFGNQFNVTANWNSPLPINNNVLYASQTGSYKITAFYSNLSAATTVSVYQPLNLVEGASGQLMNGIEKPPSTSITVQTAGQNSTASGISGFFTAIISASILPYIAVLILIISIAVYKFSEPKTNDKT